MTRSTPVVVNSGIPGENSTELRARFAREIDAVQPQVVVIYIGMNDAVNDRKFVAPLAFRDNVQAMLNEARAADATTLLVAIQPVDERRLMQRHSPDAYGDTVPNRRIQRMNQELQAIAKRNSFALIRFDRTLRAAGGPGPKLSTDGVHLNAEGYALLAEAVWVPVRKILQPGHTILCIGDSLTFGQGVRPQDAGVVDQSGRAYLTYPEQLRELAVAANP